VTEQVALITGVTGQDGGYLAERLVGEGWRVHGTVRPDEAVPEHLDLLGDAVVLHELDLRQPERVAELIADTAAAEVYNLAGISSVGQSWDEPVLTAEVNAVAVVAMLEAIHGRQRRGEPRVRFVQASSAEIFAGAASTPQDEKTGLTPRSPYGASKAFAHQICHVYRAIGVHAAAVILYNHESPRRPESFVTRKITRTVAAIADGNASGLVLGNLEPRRDWGWAPEYVDAMVLAARHQTPEDFVIATGVGHSVAEFVAAAFAHVGITDWRAHVTTDPAFSRAVDPVDLVGDATRAREVLGWQATVTFNELVGRMVDADRKR
jgi:GDPmannose 4,6-dehydratase